MTSEQIKKAIKNSPHIKEYKEKMVQIKEELTKVKEKAEQCKETSRTMYIDSLSFNFRKICKKYNTEALCL